MPSPGAALGEKKPKVFLSYARADDEAFVERLHRDLIEAGVEVWWDRAAMESRGRTFLQEIRDAIEGVDRVVAVVGPAAISSQYVRYEWDHALLFAKGIVPILRLGTYELLPEELLGENTEGLARTDLARLHCPDFRAERPYPDALAELVKVVHQPMATLGACYAPALPPHFLPRRNDITRLQGSVLADVQRPTVITSVSQIAALQGMGGIGKSVLAAAFAHTIAARRAFTDGILWLSAGQEATSLTRLGNMRQVGDALRDDPQRYVDERTAKQHLATVLRNKVCLIVLDDVWSMEQVEIFRDALGPRCRLLVTTRDAGLVTALGARRHEVDVLADTQALILLGEWCGADPGSLPPQAPLVARQCGNLPFALALCGALLRDNPDRWGNVLHRLEHADLGKIQQRLPNYPYLDVFRALQVSVDALASNERDRYTELAVFPENTLIPESAITTLWRMDAYDAQELLDLFVRRSLARRPAPGRISLHDLQTDFTRAHCSDLPALHAALVDTYAAINEGPWSGGPDDGYFFQHLPQHLAAADRMDELSALLCDYDWLSAKLRATNAAATLADYDLIGKHPDLTLIQQALRLSIPAVTRDCAHLPGQLLGRLRGAESPGLQKLLLRAENSQGRVWLRPRFASLTPPGGPLRQILAGHKTAASAVALFPDGGRALSGSWDATLRLWDLATGETLRIFKGHSGAVSAVTVLPDRSRALSGSIDNTIRLWDLATGEALRTFEGHMRTITALAVLAEGRRALSGSGDRTLRLWDLATGETLRTFEGHTNGIGGIAVLGDGRRAVSSSNDNTLRLWNLGTGETLRIFEGHTYGVSAVALTKDGTRALSGSRDATLRLWDLATGETLRTFEGHTGAVLAVAVLADARSENWRGHDCRQQTPPILGPKIRSPRTCARAHRRRQLGGGARRRPPRPLRLLGPYAATVGSRDRRNSAHL
jgi:WD40 repeat protein